MEKFEIIFYAKEDGTEPVVDFLSSLNVKLRAKTLRAIKMLETNGYELREPISKPLDDGIFELRIQAAGDISRVLYFFVVGRKAILTNGFVKKTQKTPHEEIERAKRYRADYLNRQEDRT